MHAPVGFRGETRTAGKYSVNPLPLFQRIDFSNIFFGINHDDLVIF
jgi:hypothetical protein